jgi:cell division protease FtsH
MSQLCAALQVGHALVSTAVAKLLPGSASVQKLSIIPRTGGALGFTYIPPNTEDRALMFDSEIKGQLAMLMGGRAAEQLTCASVSTGAQVVWCAGRAVQLTLCGCRVVCRQLA